jgi:hypothetical protein
MDSEISNLNKAERTIAALHTLAVYSPLPWAKAAIRGILSELSEEELEDCQEIDYWVISHCNKI